MAVIYSYPKLSTLQGKDLLLISDVSSKNKPTMRVELKDIASYVGSQLELSGTEHYLPVFTTSGLGDSIIKQDVDLDWAQVLGELNVDENLSVAKSARVNDQLVVGSNFTSIPQRNFIAPGLVAVQATPLSTDTRTGVVFVGDANISPGFTRQYHQLNLYTSSDYSDPTNFSDAKAFEYSYNDSYVFARIQAEDYAGGNIAPLWEVGDFGETTNARWKVNSGDYAKYSDGVVDFFSVTPVDAKFKVPLELEDALIDSLGQPGASNQVLSSTGTATRWRKMTSFTDILVPHFQTATPGGSTTYIQSNNIVDFDWSGGSGTFEYILPSATAIPYRKIRFVNNSTVTASNKIHITAPVGETIDGGAFYEINKAYNGCAVWSDGIEWIVIQAKA